MNLMQSPQWLIGGAFLLAVLACSAALIVLLRRISLQREDLRQSVLLADAASSRALEAERELETVLQLNRDLVQARDEHALVQAALSAVNRLAGGVGCSYIPFDAWGQPLPAFTFGDLPAPVIKGWAEHLVSEPVRSRCLECQQLYAAPGQECPLHIGPLGMMMAIYCLPLVLGGRRLGMVNLYLSPGQELKAGTHRFLESLLAEMALGIEAMRLRDQEMNTLRTVQRLRSPRNDLVDALEALLTGVCGGSALNGLLLQVRPMADERLSNLKVQIGLIPPELPSALVADLSRALKEEEKCLGCGEDGLSWMIEPLTLPEGQVLGTLTALNSTAGEFMEGDRAALQMTAAQAALMVENERANLSLEYSLIIQERTRLAREIHDGLAQTLAFLKIQGAQMQSAIGQEDHARLARLLQENRAALAEAYKETRQAIDNLRLSLDQGLIEWVSHAARDFEKATAIQIDVAIQADNLDLVPEIQAQLVRIVQEALNNVRKHAHASSVRILLRRWENDLILEIIDDGDGFDPEDVPIAAQYGLRGMRERSELIGGEFQITSQPKCGTTVRVFIPGQPQEIEK